jgi:AcrR family transcriptional regulator
VKKVDLARRAEIGRLKRERTRRGIIDTSIRVIAERGFDAPTIDDFVLAAGVAHGTFYNYYPTREQLLVAVAAHVVDTLDRQVVRLYRAARTDDPAVRMSVALRYFVQMSRELPHWGWIIVRMIPIEGGPLSEEMRRGVLGDLTSGKRRGRFKMQSIDAALAFAMGTLMISIRTALSQNVPDDFAESMASMFFQGLGISAKEADRIAAVPMPVAITATPHDERENERGRVAKTPKKANSALSQPHR